MARPLRIEFPGAVYHITSRRNYVWGRKGIPKIGKSQRFTNKPPLEDILRSKVLGDIRKRNISIGEAVWEHGYT